MDKQLKERKLQFHYYFNNESHSMDALVRNQCETEIISILYEIANILDVSVTIESEARQEGGLRDIWRLANSNAGILSVIVGIASIAIPLLPKSDSELERLQKEELRLSIEEKSLRIQALKQQANKDKIEPKTIKQVAEVVNESHKVITRRSNLFKHLCAYSKVTHIGVSELDCHGKPLVPESLIKRSKFKNLYCPPIDYQYKPLMMPLLKSLHLYLERVNINGKEYGKVNISTLPCVIKTLNKAF